MNRFYTRLPNMEGEYDVMIRPRKLGRDFTRHDGDKLKDHSIIRLLFLIILPCVALKTEAKTAIKHTENLTLIEIYSLLACRMEQNILGKKTKKEE